MVQSEPDLRVLISAGFPFRADPNNVRFTRTCASLPQLKLAHPPTLTPQTTDISLTLIFLNAYLATYVSNFTNTPRTDGVLNDLRVQLERVVTGPASSLRCQLLANPNVDDETSSQVLSWIFSRALQIHCYYYAKLVHSLDATSFSYSVSVQAYALSHLLSMYLFFVFHVIGIHVTLHRPSLSSDVPR